MLPLARLCTRGAYATRSHCCFDSGSGSLIIKYRLPAWNVATPGGTSSPGPWNAPWPLRWNLNVTERATVDEVIAWLQPDEVPPRRVPGSGRHGGAWPFWRRPGF